MKTIKMQVKDATITIQFNDAMNTIATQVKDGIITSSLSGGERVFDRYCQVAQRTSNCLQDQASPAYFVCFRRPPKRSTSASDSPRVVRTARAHTPPCLSRRFESAGDVVMGAKAISNLGFADSDVTMSGTTKWPVYEKARRIIRQAVERYRQPDGFEGHLVEAAWQLEQIGNSSWPALRNLAFSGVPECEFFIGALVRTQGVSPVEQFQVLVTLARFIDVNVRSRLLELLDEMPSSFGQNILKELASQSQPDDAVTDRAREALRERLSR